MLGHRGITGGGDAARLPFASIKTPESDCQTSEAQKELLTFVIIINKALP